MVGLKNISDLFTMSLTQNRHFNDLSEYSIYGNRKFSPKEKD